MSTTVVFGPKTRVGQALTERLGGTGEDVVLVARDDTDAKELADLSGNGVRVVNGSEGHLAEEIGLPDRLRIIVAALGPVHPHQPDVEAESAGVLRDLGMIEQVLDVPGRVQVVLVSTVLALAPQQHRRYYGGWKALVEQQLDALIALRGDRCSMSVVYPGRMTEDRHALYTRFGRVAKVVLSFDPDRPASRILGRDARIKLLVRSISLASRSLLGAWVRST